jgi:hypothetical protein
MSIEAKLKTMLGENYAEDDKDQIMKWMEEITKEREFKVLLNHKVIQDFIVDLEAEISSMNYALQEDPEADRRLIDKRNLFRRFVSLFKVGNKEEEIKKIIS